MAFIDNFLNLFVFKCLFSPGTDVGVYEHKVFVLWVSNESAIGSPGQWSSIRVRPDITGEREIL